MIQPFGVPVFKTTVQLAVFRYTRYLHLKANPTKEAPMIVADWLIVLPTSSSVCHQKENEIDRENRI